MQSTFAFLPPEQQQVLLADILFNLRTATCGDSDKVKHNLQATIYLASMKTMRFMDFTNGELMVDWKNWNLFWPDKAYWELRDVDVTDFLEGTTTYSWQPYGDIVASTAVNADGSLIDEDFMVNAMDYIYAQRYNLINVNAKSWEVMTKITNLLGLYDSQDTFPAASSLQSMRREIQCGIKLYSSEILAKASESFTVLITTREVAEQVVKNYETYVELCSQEARHSTRGVNQMMLMRLCEALQVAVTSGQLPKNINQGVYSDLIAGVNKLAQASLVDQEFGYVQRLRSLLAKFTRSFLQHKLRQESLGPGLKTYVPAVQFCYGQCCNCEPRLP